MFIKLYLTLLFLCVYSEIRLDHRTHRAISASISFSRSSPDFSAMLLIGNADQKSIQHVNTLL